MSSFMNIMICLLCFTSHIKCHLLDLPPDILSDILSNYLHINDRTQYISTLNRRCYRCLNSIRGREIHRSDIRNLSHWFSYGYSACHLNEIKFMIPRLKLTELYYLYLPKLLRNLFSDWMKKTLFCNGMHESKSLNNNEALKETLNAMDLHPVSIITFNNLSSIHDSTKLLLLSSRSLLNYFVPSYYANTNRKNSGQIRYYTNVPYFRNFPWLSPDWDSAFDVYRLNEWSLMMTYLYEFYFICHIRANLRSTFYLDGESKNKLIILINKYGFIPWSKATIQSIRNKFKSCDIYKIYLEFNVRVLNKLALNIYMNPNKIQFKTYLFINLKQNHCNVTLNQIEDQTGAFKREVLFLCWHNWHYQSANWLNQYIDLVGILSELLKDEDRFIAEIFLDHYNNSHFREDTIYHLWKSGVKLFSDPDGKIKRLLTKVINETKYTTMIANNTHM
eukprot:117161_1